MENSGYPSYLLPAPSAQAIILAFAEVKGSKSRYAAALRFAVRTIVTANERDADTDIKGHAKTHRTGNRMGSALNRTMAKKPLRIREACHDEALHPTVKSYRPLTSGKTLGSVDSASALPLRSVK